jgi:hypothetical protein
MVSNSMSDSEAVRVYVRASTVAAPIARGLKCEIKYRICPKYRLQNKSTITAAAVTRTLVYGSNVISIILYYNYNYIAQIIMYSVLII